MIDLNYNRGTLVSTIFPFLLLTHDILLLIGMWNSYKINVLENHLATLSSKYNQVVDSVQLLADQHSQLATDVKLMSRLLKTVLAVESNHRKMVVQSISLIDRLRDTVNNVVSIITSGQQRRVSPRLLNGDALATLYLSLKQKAKSMDCEMLFEQPSDIYEAESYYVYDERQKLFGIYVSIPLIPISERLSLYEHIPYPILNPSTMANATLTPMSPVERYIAVLTSGPSSTPSSAIDSHKYRVLSESELQTCFKLRKTYLCGGRNTLKTDIKDSCIGSLYLRDTTLIKKNCEVRIEPAREVAVKLSPTEWLVYSPVSFSAPVHCGNKVTKAIRFERQTQVKLIEDCRLQLNSHYLSTDLNIMFDYEIEKHVWAFAGNIFEDLRQPVEDLNAMIMDLVNSKSKFSIKDLSHLKHHFTKSDDQLSKLWDSVSSLNIFSWFGNVYTFLVYLLIIWVIYIAISRGWVKKCIQYGSRQRRYNDLSIARPFKPPFAGRPLGLNPESREDNYLVPPPYSSVVMDMERNNHQPSAPLLELNPLASPYVPAASPSVSKNGCVIRDQKGNPDYFICNQHDPNSVQGCSGYFTKPKKSKKP